ncbi:hypothetical protein C0J52_13092 [Blattella germanica]|nr:hypothetical protein C0J52_13092 [Blattella germanica]
MTFRKGRKRRKAEKIIFREEELTVMNSFKYLGITLQTTESIFGIHVKEKAGLAIRAINDINILQEIPLETAMKLFRTKIVPILTYGVHLIWQNLKIKELKEWEKVKAMFLKRAVGVSKFTPSRYVYLLTREPVLVEDLCYTLLFPATNAYKELVAENLRKREEIKEDFYSTSAMIDRAWTGPNQRMRNVITRLALHGFHHKLCHRTKFHVILDECVCKFCELKCNKYHVLFCSKSVRNNSEQ